MAFSVVKLSNLLYSVPRPSLLRFREEHGQGQRGKVGSGNWWWGLSTSTNTRVRVGERDSGFLVNRLGGQNSREGLESSRHTPA